MVLQSAALLGYSDSTDHTDVQTLEVLKPLLSMGWLVESSSR